MKKGKILYAKKDSLLFIKMNGAIKYSNTSGFDIFIERLHHDTSVKDVLIDLNEAIYIDSTNLGLMAEIASFMTRKYSRVPTLLSTNKDITTIIENVGLDKVFHLVKNPETYRETFQEILPIDRTEFEKAKMILEAHKNLMLLNHKNKKQFKNVVDLLEDQINKYPEE